MTSAFATSQRHGKAAVRGDGGMVAAQNRAAAAVGAAVLADGGNAVDAAVATAFALATLEPWMSGLGGGGTMLVHLAAERRTVAVDFGMVAPRRLDAADYPLTGATGGDLFGWPAVLDDRNVSGPLSIAVPGSVDGLGLALEQFGTRPLAAILEPAIALADKGLPIDWFSALLASTGASGLRRFPASAAVWLPGGLPPVPDSTGAATWLPLPGLAGTLRTLAREGRRAFYEGALARGIAADVQALGGRLAADDLAGYRARIVDPLQIAYRDHRVLAMPGLYAGRTLARSLELLGPVATPDYGDFAAVLKTAYDERLGSMGDSAAQPSCTTHIAAVDRHGNLVSLTNTLLSLFGSRVVLPSSGVLMNNGIMWFDPRPGGPNALAPGKRPLSNMCPTLAFAADGRALALGASGGRKILPAVLQILSHVLDGGLHLEAAFARPRLDYSGGDLVTLDSRIPAEVREALAARWQCRELAPTVYPLGWACPVGVLRQPGGTVWGTAEPMQPWADAVAG
ncbi:MAG: gamma-glutamyltransferase [Geminicoccaceae bacterium]